MLNLSPLARRALLVSGSAAAIVRPQPARAWFWVFVGGFLAAQYLHEKADDKSRRIYTVTGVSPLPAPEQGQPEDPLMLRIAARFDGSKEVARHLLNTMGPIQAEMFLNNKMGLWQQRNGRNGPNILQVRLHNNSMDIVRGEVEFAIDNDRRREFTFMDDAYKLDGHGTLELDIPLRVEFQTPGVKRINVVNQPRQIIAPFGEMFVLPFNIESKEV